jgi:hypothetical protein
VDTRKVARVTSIVVLNAGLPALALAIVAASWRILVPLVLLLLTQQLWIYLSARRSARREELFRIITENAVDMIALVNVKGLRLYNSSAIPKSGATQQLNLPGRPSSSRFTPKIVRRFWRPLGRLGLPASAKARNIACATKAAPGEFSSPPPAPSETPKQKWRSW